MAEVALKIRDLSKSFGDNEVVKKLSLDIYQGEVFTLLGSSGCGKTTTLRMIAGLERPNGGRISFQDRDWVAMDENLIVPPQKRNVGLVFQNYAIWPHMTVFEHVAYPLKNMKMPADQIRAKVAEVLAIVGMDGFSERPAVLLSGGQQQRVAVARALAPEPDLLLLDEPFSNLDVNLRHGLRVELAQIQKRLGLTLILVTHDQIDAFSLSHRIGVMRDGRIEQMDPGERIYEHPESIFVREFVGKSVVFQGTCREINGSSGKVDLGKGAEIAISSAEKLANISPGDEVSVWARPEDIAVDRHDGDGGDDGRLRGRVEQAVFLGDKYECEIALECGQSIWTYVPRAMHPKSGEQVRLSVNPTLAHIAQR